MSYGKMFYVKAASINISHPGQDEDVNLVLGFVLLRALSMVGKSSITEPTVSPTKLKVWVVLSTSVAETS